MSFNDLFSLYFDNESTKGSAALRSLMTSMAFFFLAMVPITGYLFTLRFLHARETMQWPTAEGTLIKTDVRKTPQERFYTDVKYQYEVAGQRYTGTQITPDDEDEYKTREKAQAAVEGLKSGQKVQVYYEPNQPDLAILQPGVRMGDYLLLLSPLFFLSVAAFRLVPMWRHRQAEKAKLATLPQGRL